MRTDVRAAIKELDPHYLITDLQPMDAVVEKAQSGTRFSLLLIGSFAVIAALLAGVGLYGVLATVVRQRTAEIGIRMALGAQSRNIFQLVVGQGLRLAGIGVVAGLLAAFFLTRGMNTMLVGVKATDPVDFCHDGIGVPGHRECGGLAARVASGRARPDGGSARRVRFLKREVAVLHATDRHWLMIRCKKFGYGFVQEFCIGGVGGCSRRVSPQ